MFVRFFALVGDPLRLRQLLANLLHIAIKFAERGRIAALTADALADDRERCLASGMGDYLTTPVSRARLAAMVERWAGAAHAGPGG